MAQKAPEQSGEAIEKSVSCFAKYLWHLPSICAIMHINLSTNTKGMDMLSKSEFLEKYHVLDELEQSGLSWDCLETIGRDHEGRKPVLEEIASELETLLKNKAAESKVPVHSIRSRVKDSAHLVEKICRKCGGSQIEKYMGISVNNYRDIVRDLIGVRILTVSKEEGVPVHKMMMTLFPKVPEGEGPYMAERPVAYVRYGDRKVFAEDKDGIHPEYTMIGYRSQHYIVRYQGVYCEIQVRTLAEEAFGEFDHRVKYPYRQSNRYLKRYSSSVSQLLDSVDELISSCLTMGPDGWEKNEGYYDDAEYYDSNVNQPRQRTTPVTMTQELIDDGKIKASAYAESYFQRKG